MAKSTPAARHCLQHMHTVCTSSAHRLYTVCTRGTQSYTVCTTPWPGLLLLAQLPAGGEGDGQVRQAGGLRARGGRGAWRRARRGAGAAVPGRAPALPLRVALQDHTVQPHSGGAVLAVPQLLLSPPGTRARLRHSVWAAPLTLLNPEVEGAPQLYSRLHRAAAGLALGLRHNVIDRPLFSHGKGGRACTRCSCSRCAC